MTGPLQLKEFSNTEGMSAIFNRGYIPLGLLSNVQELLGP